MGPLATVEYTPTPYFILIYLVILLPIHYGIALLGIGCLKIVYKSYLSLMYPLFDLLFVEQPTLNNTDISPPKKRSLKPTSTNKNDSATSSKRRILNKQGKRTSPSNGEIPLTCNDASDDNDSVLTNVS